VTRPLLVLLALSGAAAAAPSEAVFPAQQVPLRFSHRTHLAKKIACDFCHERAASSTRAVDNLIPDEEVCATCHMIDRARPSRTERVTPCASCHPGFAPAQPVARVQIPSPNLRFDHKAHVGRQVACTQCHRGLDRVDLAGRGELPEMALCLSCHDSQKKKLHASGRCATCHPVKADGTLATRFASGTLVPSGKLRGDAHTADFRDRHAAPARADERYCLTCHRRDECQQCHNGVVRPMSLHPNDYISLHAIDARRAANECAACHRAQSFCLSCHERLGVVDPRTGAGGAFRPLGPRRFHPDGWADPTASAQPNHHAWQAQRNLRTCVSCHREDTCLECHASAGGAGALGKMQVSPHPLDWISSGRCEALSERNERVCLRCHRAGDPQLDCR
jgi:hypothetical protein